MGTPTVGGLTLAFRGGTLRAIPAIYRLGTLLIGLLLFVFGGFIPVIRSWLCNEINDFGDLVRTFGGVWLKSSTRDPDSDYGPALRRSDSPRLFEEVAEVARRLGVRPPEEIRLAFLPCSGVVAWRKSRALLLGLPLLDVLTVSELRAVLAHELAHLARGDDARLDGSMKLVEGLSRGLDDHRGRVWGPLRLWSRICRDSALALVGPIARGQEARADRISATIAGGQVSASALIKVALVQPLFREVLRCHDPGSPIKLNLYAMFREFWNRLPESLLEEMRLRLLVEDQSPTDSPHPPLPDRIAMIQTYPERADNQAENQSAITLVGDPEWLEQMLHDRLFGLAMIEPSVFHKAGT